MAHFWCISAPLFSHADWGGYLRTARALARKGHRVTWLSGESLRAPIEGAGLPFVAISESGWRWPPPPMPEIGDMTPQEAVMVRYRRALDTWLMEDKVAEGVRALIAIAERDGKPDAILTDPFLSASALAAEVLDVPLIVAGWPALRELDETLLYPVQKVLSDDSRQRLDRLCKTFNITGRNFSSGPAPAILSPLLHLCYFSPTWYDADMPNMLPQTQFFGGVPSSASEPPWLAEIPQSAPLALVTLGTTFTGDLGFYAWAAQAAARAGLLPVVAIGGNPITPEAKTELIRALPRSTRLVNFVPFDAILPRCKVMIHHGGMGTAHAAAVYGLPQIVVPHAADQRGQARRAAQAKIGLNLTAHDVRHGVLREAVNAVLKDDKVLANVKALASEMHALGGPDAAALAVEKVLR
jgi:UDP:flavonoid glycosyltransferase YjiC (YdhE family)